MLAFEVAVIAALVDFLAGFGRKRWIALTAVSIAFAAITEVAAPGPARPITAAWSAWTAGLLLISLAFLAFSARNSVIVPRYRGSDLLVPWVLVVSALLFWAIVAWY